MFAGSDQTSSVLDSRDEGCDSAAWAQVSGDIWDIQGNPGYITVNDNLINSAQEA